MKHLIQSASDFLVPLLPWGVRSALTQSLAKKGDYQALCEHAKAYGVVGFVAEGQYGLIEGSSADNAVFRSYLQDGVFSVDSSDLLHNALEHGGTYLDIGANIGLTLIPIARNPLVTCHAFEPDPNNFKFLTANVARNCENNNVSLHNLALFDRPAMLALEMNPANSGDKRIRKRTADGALDEHTWKIETIKAARLDDELPAISRPLVAKIDTQGAEPFVIAGGQRTLSSADAMAMEFWPYGMRRMEGDIESVLEFIVDHFSGGTFVIGSDRAWTQWQSAPDLTNALRSFASSQGPNDTRFADIFITKQSPTTHTGPR